MRIHNFAPEDVAHELSSSGEGLMEEEAVQRLREYGYNEIKAVRHAPLWRRLAAQFTHFLALLLWISAALCFLSEYLHPGEGMASLGLAVVAVIVINAVFTFVQEYRAERAVEALERLLPFNVKVVRQGIRREIPARDVVPGDVVLLSEGDKVPADARLVEAQLLTVNNAPLTGESEPSTRSHLPFEGAFLESPNIVFAGTLVNSGSGKALVFSTGMSTEFGKIVHLTSGVEPGVSPLQREIEKVTRIITAIALTTGIFFFGVGTLTGRGFWHNLLFAIGITIANVPEGLLPTVTLALAMGSQRMVRKRALIKTLTSVETLGSVTVICTDKTGTLTSNRMEVEETWSPDAGQEAEKLLLSAAYLCNNAVCEDCEYRGDPTETALLKAARAKLGDLRAERREEIPFDAERKRMTTVHVLAGEQTVFTKGALETVLPLCSSVAQDGTAVPLEEEKRNFLLNHYRGMMDRGLRVIAFAFKKSVSPGEPLEADLVFIGLMGLKDPPRPEVPEAIRKCRDAGIRVIMITGDAGRTATAIARQIGMAGDSPAVIEGPELDTMPDTKLQDILGLPEVIFARVTPHHKMRIVSALKDEQERVAVTGDGVNDAPALKRADIGIAMGISGTDVAKEAADMVLLDDNFATIVNAVEEGRAIFENIRKFITYIFAHGTPEAVPYIMFALFKVPLPLTVMQILAIDLGTETIPALALGAERPEEDIMKISPHRKRGLIDGALLTRSYLFLGSISALSVLFIYFYVLYKGGWHWGMSLSFDSLLARQASSATFLGIVIMQVGTVFACRSSHSSVFRLGFFSNRMVIVGIVAELLMAFGIIYHPWGHRIFGTAPLDGEVWLLLISFCLFLFLAEEARKAWLRSSERVGGGK